MPYFLRKFQAFIFTIRIHEYMKIAAQCLMTHMLNPHQLSNGQMVQVFFRFTTDSGTNYDIKAKALGINTP
jgi:hypothetical protein